MEIKTIRVGLLETCCYVLWQDDRGDCVVIDPGAEPDKVLAACEGRKIAVILLTHGHFDHIGAVDKLMTSGTALAIHPLDAPMLQNPELNACALIGCRVTCAPATHLVEEGSRLELAGISLTVLHTPGHTPGSVCYQAEGHLFTGDTMFRFGCGRTDLPGGSMEDMRASLRRLEPLRRELIIHPGHEA